MLLYRIDLEISVTPQSPLGGSIFASNPAITVNVAPVKESQLLRVAVERKQR